MSPCRPPLPQKRAMFPTFRRWRRRPSPTRRTASPSISTASGKNSLCHPTCRLSARCQRRSASHPPRRYRPRRQTSAPPHSNPWHRSSTQPPLCPLIRSRMNGRLPPPRRRRRQMRCQQDDPRPATRFERSSHRRPLQDLPLRKQERGGGRISSVGTTPHHPFQHQGSRSGQGVAHPSFRQIDPCRNPLRHKRQTRRRWNQSGHRTPTGLGAPRSRRA